MKKTISFVIAAAAVAMALVSCAKETPAGKDSENGVNTDGTRALTVSFAQNATKTTLSDDGITPVWAAGDVISLNGAEFPIPADAVGKSSCTIYTTEQGSITAVYPAKAHRQSDPYFKVSDTQDGSFGCANICVAKVESDENELKFKNVTAVFAVPVPDGTTALTLTVTSLGKIDSQTGQRGTEKAEISTKENGEAAYEIIVNNKCYDTPSVNDSVYVAVAVDPETGVLLADLNFDIQYTDSESKTHYAQGGLSPNYIESKGQNPLEYRAKAGTIYTPVLHEYVTVEMTINNEIKTYKWATMNVGASSVTGNGYYFAWGETTGHAAVTNGNNAFVTGFDDNAKGFSWANCPLSNHYKGDGTDYFFSKYVPQDKASLYGIDGYYDDKKVLDFEDDAARANWGGSWRMPTKEEYDALLTATNTDKNCFSNGVLTINGHSDLTFPAAGVGDDGTNLKSVGTFSCYQSSSLDTKYSDANYCLSFYKDGIGTDSRHRYTGCPVRALSE